MAWQGAKNWTAGYNTNGLCLRFYSLSLVFKTLQEQATAHCFGSFSKNHIKILSNVPTQDYMQFCYMYTSACVIFGVMKYFNNENNMNYVTLHFLVCMCTDFGWMVFPGIIMIEQKINNEVLKGHTAKFHGSRGWYLKKKKRCFGLFINFLITVKRLLCRDKPLLNRLPILWNAAKLQYNVEYQTLWKWTFPYSQPLRSRHLQTLNDGYLVLIITIPVHNYLLLSYTLFP